MKQNILFLFFSLLTIHSFCQTEMKPEETEVWEPIPSVVTPGEGSNAPSDAIVLFNGKDFDHWIGDKGEAPDWEIQDGIMTVKPGSGMIKTKKEFGDCQLHIEWRTPAEVKGESQGRGNSGIFFMGQYEIQVLDNFNNRTYSNGQAGSVYKDKAPLVNACKAPGAWQDYNIIFMVPEFNKDGSLLKPARFTVFHNGILIQNNVEVAGVTAFIGIHTYTAHPSKMPLGLQDHGNPVSYRNIWIREL